MDLSILADFHRVAAAGSLSKASRASGRPKATLSRRVRQLEESLGVRLVERGPHALRLTADGQALYERTHTLLRDIEEVGQNLASGSERPRGLLRVSAPVLFADTHGGRLAAEFALRYPDVQLELVAGDRIVDLVEEGFDVVVRANPHPASELTGRCFARDTMLVVASPSLPMPKAGTEQAPARVPAVTMTRFAAIDSWSFQTDGQPFHVAPDYRLRLSSLVMVQAAVCAGGGAALLPRSLVCNDIVSGRLVQWGVFPGRPVELWVLHNSRRLVSPKVAAFVEFLVERFPERML